MIVRPIARLVMLSLLCSSSAVFAQGHQGGDHHDNQHRGGPPQHGGSHRPAPPREAANDRPGGAIPHNDWHKGERLPAEYRDRNYVVDDWRGHGLQAPPRGYQWVGVNGDYVLAAIATGVIANVLLSGH